MSQKRIYTGPSLNEVVKCLAFDDRKEAVEWMLSDMTSDDGSCYRDPDPDSLTVCEFDGDNYIEYIDRYE
jgi:hypothetical protein